MKKVGIEVEFDGKAINLTSKDSASVIVATPATGGGGGGNSGGGKKS